MTENKYVIVRVDNRCPVEEEEDICLVDRIKMFPCFNDKRLSCKKCRYGDTKEQLIMKVAQVMLRKFIANYLANGIKPKLADEQIQIVYKNYLEVAKEIVEFLGVLE